MYSEEHDAYIVPEQCQKQCQELILLYIFCYALKAIQSIPGHQPGHPRM